MNIPDNKTLKNQIIKDTAKYNIAHYASQFLGIFTSVAMRRLLGPYYIGIWNILQLVMSYFTYLSLGVDTAAQYKIPFFRGKKDKKAETEITNCVFSFLLVASVLSSIIVLIATFILRDKYPTEIIVGLIAISFCIILQRLYTYYLVVLRANNDFSTISKSVLFDAVINLILILLLVNNFKIYGLYIAVALMPLINTLFIDRLAKYKIKLVFNPKQTLNLIVYSFPFLTIGVLNIVLRSIDRLIIAKMLGITAVGYYSLALMGKNYVVGLYNNFGIVTIPRILETYGREGNVESIKKFVTSTTEAIAYLFPPFLGVMFLISPILVKWVLPNFVPGILAMQILLFDVFFQSCSPQIEPFLIALNKQKNLVPIIIGTIILSFGINYFFIKIGLGINGVAIGTSIASFVYFIFTLTYAMRHFAGSKEILKFIGIIIFPLVYAVFLILTCQYFIHIHNAYLEVSAKIIILVLAYMPLLFYIERKTNVLSLFLGHIKEKLGKFKLRK
ncbi:MAG: oligosaccharide flippase family protein [Candidatus Omnitrophota bacterium]